MKNLLFLLLFSINSIYGQYKCELEINSDKLNHKSIDTVFSFSSSEFENIAKQFREKTNKDCFKVLYYRNTGEESLNYLYLDEDLLKIQNSNGFSVVLGSDSNYKKKLKKELEELLPNSFTLLTQSCPKNYSPIGSQIIEHIWIKKNNMVFIVYMGRKDSIHSMKQNSLSLKLRNLIDEIYYKWIEFK